MARIELTVPDIGGFADVPIIEVFVKPGDAIAKDATLVTLESEKATVDVPASAAGTVADVKVRVGDKVSQGAVLVTLEAASDAELPVAPVSAPTAAPAPPAAAAPAPSAPPAAPAPAPIAPAAAAPPSNGAAYTNGSTVHASPGIRRFARELGVELARVRGSGPNGRITREDVQGFVKGALSNGVAPAQRSSGSGLSLPPWPAIDFAQFGPIERVALSRIKKISGPALQRNWVTIPHVTQHDEADVTELEAFRKTVNAEQKDAKVTMLAFLMKAAVAALERFPDFNASLDGDALVLKRYYNIGFAADTPGGLVVPVIRNVDSKGVVALARETAELAAKARDGKLGPAEMSGGTFTISSLGGIGGTAFTPIINAPEVAILGVSRTATRPVWDGAAFVPRLMLPLSLSYDHRVIDGAAAARFTVALAGLLADLRRTLL
jgi:pyruvate dehydrogenase E2 component (dihydrolipoamide acetyltransferase)